MHWDIFNKCPCHVLLKFLVDPSLKCMKDGTYANDATNVNRNKLMLSIYVWLNPEVCPHHGAEVSLVTSAGHVVEVLPTAAQPRVHVGHLSLHQLKIENRKRYFNFFKFTALNWWYIRSKWDQCEVVSTDTWKCPIFSPNASLTWR